jgi:hypothetical protein
METYQLIISVSLFLGVMGVIALLDRRGRTERAHFERIHQTLVTCLQSLQAIQSGGQTQTAKTLEALASLRTAAETGLASVRAAAEAGTETSSRALANLSGETTRAVKEAVTRAEAALLHQQKAREEASSTIVTKLSEITKSTSRDLLSEAERTTEAVHDLKASLEESVRFDVPSAAIGAGR